VPQRYVFGAFALLNLGEVIEDDGWFRQLLIFSRSSTWLGRCWRPAGSCQVSSPALEGFLARLYSDEATKKPTPTLLLAEAVTVASGGRRHPLDLHLASHEDVGVITGSGSELPCRWPNPETVGVSITQRTLIGTRPISRR
jgi:hypothetical protein